MNTRVRPDEALVRIRRSCGEATTADDLFARLSDDVHDLIPHDGAAWFGADPVTLLATSPVRIESLDGASCDPFWHNEFHVQDTAQFVDLARSAQPAAGLQLSLDGNQIRSSRYREILRPQGYEDELRAVLRVGENIWGLVALYRDAGRAGFDADDVSLLSAASPVIASALRDHVRRASPWLGSSWAPGLVVFDHHSQVVSANAEAFHWLRELLPTDRAPVGPQVLAPVVDAVEALLLADQVDRHVSPLWALLARSRAVASGIDSGAARLRLRDRRGRWLVLHGSCLTTRDDAPGSVAIVIEPAKSSEIAPLIIEAYSLTRHERDVVGGLARGDTTSEIAASLFLSPHTVRDHIKTVFDKVGVSSRAELVAKLFAEHYTVPAHAHMVHVD